MRFYTCFSILSRILHISGCVKFCHSFCLNHQINGMNHGECHARIRPMAFPGFFGWRSVFAESRNARISRCASESRNARSTQKTRKRPLPRIVLLSYGLFFAINVHGGVFSASSMYSAHSVILHPNPHYQPIADC